MYKVKHNQKNVRNWPRKKTMNLIIHLKQDTTILKKIIKRNILDIIHE